MITYFLVITMGDRDDFTIFLILGLMILAILLAVFNFGFEPAAKPTGKAVFREVPFFNISTAVQVGPQQFTGIRTFSFSFDSGNLREGQTLHLGNRTVLSGALFGEKAIAYRFDIQNPSSVDISFRVVKSNELEPLIIQVNGRTVESRIYEPGDYTVHAGSEFFGSDSEAGDGVLVSISAASSGWQIWAPNLYELHNVRIDAQGFTEKATNFVFKLDEEVRTFTFGKLDLALQKNIGLLNITLNFNRIYSAPPTSAVSVAFTKADIRQGDNVVGIVAGKDSEFRGTAVLTVYFLRERISELRTPLNFTQLEYDNMNRTVVRFNVARVARQGGLMVKVENRNGLTFREFASVTGPASYEFVIARGQLTPGLNTLTVSSLEGAVFDVTDLDVKVR